MRYVNTKHRVQRKKSSGNILSHFIEKKVYCRVVLFIKITKYLLKKYKAFSLSGVKRMLNVTLSQSL